LGEFDLVKDFTYKIPGLVLAAQYGLPSGDSELLTNWWYEVRNMQRMFLGAHPDQVSPVGSPPTAAFDEMRAYLAELIQLRRTQPGDDLVTQLLVYAQESDGKDGTFDQDEMVAHLFLLPLASFGTTMDLIGNGLLGLLDQRDQWDILGTHPDLIYRAVDELLRFDASVQLTHRLATRDVDIAGTTIHEGELVYLARGAANRDPSRWSDPDRIDVYRRDPGHVGFGVGIHRCLGAGLAQAEVAAAYAALLKHVPNLRRSEDRPHQWKADTPQFRGLETLPAYVG